MDDVFCKIINREINDEIIMEGSDWIAINDLHPVAPIHVLILPKKHINGVGELTEDDVEIAGQLLIAAGQVAKKLGLDYKGYRIVINQGEDGGQIVPHLHVHLLGGKNLGPKILH